MSPASYLTAPPRVASGSIPPMAAFFWLALAVFVVAGLGGLGFVAFRGWQAWNAFTSFAAAGAAGIERLVAQADQLAQRGGGAAARLEEVHDAVQSLQRAQARIRILLAALGEMTSLLRTARAFVAQK
jgi:hypothetical protein